MDGNWLLMENVDRKGSQYATQWWPVSVFQWASVSLSVKETDSNYL